MYANRMFWRKNTFCNSRFGININQHRVLLKNKKKLVDYRAILTGLRAKIKVLVTINCN